MSHAAERIYYDEPATLEFTAEVTAIREVARVDGRQVWQIALDRTAFYPTSGGQPNDTGKLTATARSGASLDAPITDVEEDETGEVWHTTSKPLQEGTPVRGVVDAARRRDHMQQHSGQHLLSAILLRDFNAKTVSFHLGEGLSTIDLDVPALDDAQLKQAERTVHDVIALALPFSVRYVEQQEAQAMLADGLLRKLPPRAGRIRIVQIDGGIDTNACGGTHVATTAEIGPLLLRGTERVRGSLRLSFVCGLRAMQAAADDFRRLQTLAQSLSTGTDAILASVSRMQADSKAAAKERAALLAEVAAREAQTLASSATGPTTAIRTVLDPQQPGRDAVYAKMLASSLVNSTSVAVALIGIPESERMSVVLAAKPGAADCGTVLRVALDALGGRGGGSRDLAQGAMPIDHFEALGAAIAEQTGRSG
ncbi:alanyl-tRNA editing protein [Terriglobus roseus]|uniref:Alanine--tRNA ligase n=1 Tax=Terriglobus roseus TaxID=392734 RepID=A0A1H4L084_9BACT|nr:alanine--tRNA ligase-related protein [Terriglobus roseus]SEB63745.1 alanyl-tRNA synthetase [Terriglobus roseus]